MPQRYLDVIVQYLSGREYQPLGPRQLARQMGVSQADYGAFREAVKRLRDSGRIVLGERSAVTLPQIGRRIEGIYRANPRGFGFVVPDTPNAHGDLFIPPGADGGAISGDHISASVRKRGKRDGKAVFEGRIDSILKRGRSRFVGTLQHAGKGWFVMPDGKSPMPAIVIRDVGDAGQAGQKVVAEIVRYGDGADLAEGVIVETLGPQGRLGVETRAVIAAHGLEEAFSAAALTEARAVVKAFDGDSADQCKGRENLTAQTVVTIDPPDAKDYDDAISLATHRDGTVTLGVHIADVSHFVREGGALDTDARQRATSVYFPRRVVPMLPEVLSNGVCSLQEGQSRFCKSAFITYDAKGEVVSQRLAETVIRSSKRLTYAEAQAICDGQSDGQPRRIVRLVRKMAELARVIEVRRRGEGMLHLDLPAVELVLDKRGRVVDAVPEDDSYTHTLIEMFMVEANEAVARRLHDLERPFIRRIHPPPDPGGREQLSAFVRACGHKIPADLTVRDLQDLLAAVKGRPEAYAVNLAVLRTYQQAEYSPLPVGHFALASTHYCHFTSPIRRYADLTVHRLVADDCRGRSAGGAADDLGATTELANHCSQASRQAEAAERELRDVLMLQFLAGKVGTHFDGVITGLTNFGIFVQLPRYLVEGLIRIADLGDDWWEVDTRRGAVRGARSGTTHRMGDVLGVRIVGVDVARRQLNLLPDTPGKAPARPGKRAVKGKASRSTRRTPAGKAKSPKRRSRRS